MCLPLLKKFKINTNNIHLTPLYQILCKFDYLRGRDLKTLREQNLNDVQF